MMARSIKSQPLARHPISLRFLDEEHEKRFKNSWLESSLLQVRVSLVVAVALTLAFQPVDVRFLPPRSLEALTSWRFMVMLPLLAGGFVFSLLRPLRSHLFSYCATGMAVASLGFVQAAILATPDELMYFSVALIQFLVFVFVLLRIPFVSACISGVSILAGFIVSVSLWGEPTWHTLAVVMGLTAVTLMLCLGAYQRDSTARELYKSAVLLGESQDERSAWLRAFTRFIKHEVGNQLVGIRTSLDLIGRSVCDDRQEKYVQRARMSTDRMRVLLREAASATSLESAIQHEERSVIDLSGLVEERVQAFRESHPKREIVYEGERFHLLGNALRLVQLVDNLLKNAIDHGAPEEVIVVRMVVKSRRCELGVENGGEPLALDHNSLFRAWTSGAANATPDEHFGIGLYIAQKVAENHGGDIRASRRSDGTGAKFLVILPANQDR